MYGIIDCDNAIAHVRRFPVLIWKGNQSWYSRTTIVAL